MSGYYDPAWDGEREGFGWDWDKPSLWDEASDYDRAYDKAVEDGTLAEHGFYEDWDGPDSMDEQYDAPQFVPSIPLPDFDPDDLPF